VFGNDANTLDKKSSHEYKFLLFVPDRQIKMTRSFSLAAAQQEGCHRAHGATGSPVPFAAAARAHQGRASPSPPAKHMPGGD
jgi:hypothetical protein